MNEIYKIDCPGDEVAFKGPQPTPLEEENMLEYIRNRHNGV
jgi:hypothetical protein